MPKPVFYRANAIVFFHGDKAESIPILKEGRVEITYQDLQTGTEIREPIKTGEFFGVKAALGRNAHDETAIAVTDCTVVHFTIQEFEKLVSGNPRILMKMLQVFSTQLRRIHHQVQNLLSTDRIGTSQEAGLFAVGEYYLNEHQYPQAIYALNSYLKHWPTGTYAPQATLKIGAAKNQSQQTEKPEKEWGDTASHASLSLAEMNTQYKLGNYKDAIKGFLSIVNEDEDSEHNAYVEFRIGCCLYYLEHYSDALKQFANTVRKYPKHKSLGEAIWYMGLSHQSMGDTTKALGFFKKAIQLVPKDSAIYQKIIQTVRDIEGEKS